MPRTCWLCSILLLALPGALPAQWTAKPGGWFLSNTVSVGRFPDRFSPQAGAYRNELQKLDWGLYAVYGLREGLSVGLGQGYARLRDRREGAIQAESRGFGATGMFVMKRLTQGRHGILSAQVRGDFPILFDTTARPALGPLRPEAEARLLYGNGFGLGDTRGFVSASVGAAPIRSGQDELRYDLTVGVDLGSRAMLLVQSFNVHSLPGAGETGYSASKLGAGLLWRATPSVGVIGGYYGGIAGKNSARERTISLGLWISHDPAPPIPPGGP